MGRVSRGLRISAAAMLAASIWLSASATVPPPASALDGFTNLEADATFGESVTFSVELEGGAPDELDLLLRFADSEVTFVQPVELRGSRAEYVWDAGEDYIAPNTPISYQWRARETGADDAVFSREATILYDDDRPRLDWDVLETEHVRVHWYGGDRAAAERMGGVTSAAVQQAEELFDADLGARVDIFVYHSRDEFFGALEPAAREWVGGEARPEIRTIYAWLEAGSEAYMEVLIFHEVAHMVFADAKANPYHEPARWLNEGLAVWSEEQGATDENAFVRDAASDGRLVGFDAIVEQFPTGSDEVDVAYSQSAAFMDYIITTYGRDSIARICTAYRSGSTDAEALEEATGTPLDEIIAAWFSEFGMTVPPAIDPETLLPAQGGLPEGVSEQPGAGTSEDPDASPPGGERPSTRPATQRDTPAWLWPVAGVALIAIVALGAVALRRATAHAADGDG
ncbi:MAG: peptidase MA family metallohydrolase [Candidatus Limnocylindria bacterium]